MFNVKTCLFFFGLVGVCGVNTHAMADTESLNNLVSALSDARVACTGISNQLTELKRMAGINTAVSAVGTVSAGVALGVGIAKANVDKQIPVVVQNAIDVNYKKGAGQNTHLKSIPRLTDSEYISEESEPQNITSLKIESENLGHIRTGTMAVAGVSNIVGSVISADNASQGDLESSIANCSGAIDKLEAAAAQVRVDASDPQEDYLPKASTIVSKCRPMKNVDMSEIVKKAKGALVTGVIGATTGVVGTVVSALANSKKIRNDDTMTGIQKENNLNTTSNVLAGATTAASATSVIFNATQISTIKKIAAIVDECEGAF